MPWISVKEAWARVDKAVSLSTVYAVAHSGQVKATTLGGKILIDRDSFDALLSANSFRVIQSADAKTAHKLARMQPGRRTKKRGKSRKQGSVTRRKAS